MSIRASQIVGASLIFVAFFSGCTSTGVISTPQPSPPATGLTTGPHTSPGLRWGPLAVTAPQEGTDLARAQGTLIITNTCVYIESRGDRTLLFWPADRTTWNEEARTITFLNFDGTSATVTDADQVVLGGGGDSESESGISAEEWVERMIWVAAPDPSCSAERRFGVGVVQG